MTKTMPSFAVHFAYELTSLNTLVLIKYVLRLYFRNLLLLLVFSLCYALTFTLDLENRFFFLCKAFWRHQKIASFLMLEGPVGWMLLASSQDIGNPTLIVGKIWSPVAQLMILWFSVSLPLSDGTPVLNFLLLAREIDRMQSSQRGLTLQFISGGCDVERTPDRTLLYWTVFSK